MHIQTTHFSFKLISNFTKLFSKITMTSFTAVCQYQRLFECPAFGARRYEAEQRLGVQFKQEDIHLIVSNKEKRAAFLSFAEQICKITIQRNNGIET